LAIVGESGSGKTLSCLTLLQLNPQNFSYPSGKIIDHNSRLELSPKDATLMTWRGKRVAMIFQEPMSVLYHSMYSSWFK
jgi:ABC-type glutathione transport system ATPase component